MTTPITCSNLSKYVLFPNSSELSRKDQKKAKLIAIFLACTVIGYPICGIVYLIKRCCDKGSKVDRVATQTLNRDIASFNRQEDYAQTFMHPISTLEIPENTRIPTPFENFLRPFMEKISRAWDSFEADIGLRYLANISIEMTQNGPTIARGNPHINIENKDDQLKAILTFILREYAIRNETLDEIPNQLTIEVKMHGSKAHQLEHVLAITLSKNGESVNITDPSYSSRQRRPHNFNF
jgi:hypothetical protein